MVGIGKMGIAAMPNLPLMNRDMRLGYLAALRDADEALSKYLGPVHKGRLEVEELRKRVDSSDNKSGPDNAC